MLQEGVFPHYSFWWEGFLNISNHLPVSISQSNQIRTLIFSWMTQLSSFNQFGAKNVQFSQFALRFHRDETYLACINSVNIVINQNLFLADHA